MMIKITAGLMLATSVYLLGSMAAPDPGASAAGSSCMLPQDDKAAEGPKYVGANQCKTCHFKEFRSWKKTSMAETFNVLKPGQKEEAKKKFGLDPAKDYTKDATCLPCHVVGYGKPGGYPKLPEAGKEWTKKEIELAADREGVQCESCHGPGSELIPVFKEIKKDKRQYTTAELQAKGLVIPDEKNCVECHNKTSPTWPKDPKDQFDFKKAIKKEKEIHDHSELKYRKD